VRDWDGGSGWDRDGGSDHDWDGPQPLRVVLDGRARLSPQSALADVTEAPTLVAVRPEADPDRLQALRAAGVETLEVGAERADGADLAALLAHLWKRDVREVLVEGGATVAGAVVAAGLADRLEVHLAGVLLGDAALPAVRDLPVATLADAPRFAVEEVERCGDDLVLTYLPRTPDER
jgi:diaminohydroxyphosphoribosylaminopyrimidine deaminase/5-amino-6-(5-phosphoribosylamino)uracil reductase